MKYAIMGDSTVASGLNGTQTFNRYLSGYPMMFGGYHFSDAVHYGVGGEGLPEMYARIDTALAGDWDVLILQGGVNDLLTTSLEDMKANFIDIAAEVRATGRKFIAMTVIPRTVGMTDATYAKRDEYNAWLLSQHTGPDELINLTVDLSGTQHEARMRGSNPMSTDGVHPNVEASAEIMRTVYDAMANCPEIAAMFATRPTDAVNILPNSNMLGNEGTLLGSATSGYAPNDWRINKTSYGSELIACSVRDQAGPDTMVLGMSGTPSGLTQSGIIYSPAFDVTAGKTLRTSMYVGGEGLQGICALEIQLKLPNGGGTDTHYSYRRGGTDDDRNLLPEDFMHEVWSFPVTVPETASGAEVRYVLYYRDGAEGAGNLLIRAPKVWESA